MIDGWKKILQLLLQFFLLCQFNTWLISHLLGEEEELEVEEEEQKGPDLKLASRRDMYSICQSVGLG